ncbi:MAG: hypothetical protein NBV65_03455 [Burkholderiaceae bacterium]|nr:hypothetical protein [Burkholderiaceae bacterium]
MQVLHDANANGRADAGEGTSAVLTTLSDVAGRGQFEIPGVLPSPAYEPSRSLLQLTSSGGTSRVFSVAEPVTGPVQYMAYLTKPPDPDATRFDAVLSPLSTLGSHLLRTQLQQGVPKDSDRTAAYGEHLTYVADALGLSMAADRLISTAPSQGPVQRLIIERQLNALLVTLVSLDSGKADSSAVGWSGSMTGDIAARLGHLIEQRGSIDFTDPSQLQNVLASVLPLSIPAAHLIAKMLAPLTTAFAMAADGDFAASQASQEVVDNLARIMAARHANMMNGTLDDAAVQTALGAELDALSASLARAIRDSDPATRVIVTGISTGTGTAAVLDRNADGRLDAQDEVNGARVAANFGPGGNADPAAGRVVMTYHVLPNAAQQRPPSTLTADDRVEIAVDTANHGGSINQSWSASDANLMLKAVQDRGLVTDLSLAARGRGTSLLASIGRFADSSRPADPVTASLGAVTLLAAGSAASADGTLASTLDLRLALGPSAMAGSTAGGRIAGPLRIQAGGTQSQANANVQSMVALDTGDVALAATGFKAQAKADLASGGSGLLKIGQAALASHSAASRTEITLMSDDGGVRTDRGISALASGTGSTSVVTVLSDDGAVRIGAATAATLTERAIHVVTSGDAWRTAPGSTTFSVSRTSVTIITDAGAIAASDVHVIASGRNAGAELTMQSTQGTVLVSGATRVSASGQAATASATLSSASQVTGTAAITLTGPVTIDASGMDAVALLNLTTSAGTLKADRNGQLRGGGYAADAMATLSAAGGIVLGGNWELAASGYAARSDLVLEQLADGRADLGMGAVQVVAGGALSTASVTLQRGSATTGSIDIGALTLRAAANRLDVVNQPDQIIVQLRTAGQNFTADGEVRVTASGRNSAARLVAGSASSDATVTGALVLESLGSSSRSQATIDAGNALAITQGLTLSSQGPGGVALLTLTAAHSLTTGAASTPALEGSIRVISQGINSTSLLQLQTDGASVRVGGNVELERKALTGPVDRSTQMSTSENTASIAIDGRLALLADAAAVGGKLAASLHVRSTLDAAVIPSGSVADDKLAIIKTGGELRVESAGFNTLTEFRANLTGPRATLTTGGDFSVISTRSGDLNVRNYGAMSDVKLTGVETSLKIGGDWVVQSSQALGIAKSGFVLDLRGAAAGAVTVGDDILVSAQGYGTRAQATLLAENVASSGWNVTVTDRFDVKAFGPGAFASLNTNAHVSAIGASIIADSGTGSPGGAYAALTAGTLAVGSQAPVFLDAVRSGDIAVLNMTQGADGASYQLGSPDSSGAVYLNTGKSFAKFIDIDFANVGRTHVAIGVEDRDLSAAQARTSMLTMEGLRLGRDWLVLTESLALESAFKETLSFPSSSLDQFLTNASSKLSESAGMHWGFVNSSDPLVRAGYYLAFDYDKNGLTGLVYLGDVPNLPTTAFTIPSGTGFNPYTPTRIEVLDGRSETNSSDSVVRADVVLEAAVVEKRQLVFDSTNAMVLLNRLDIDADHMGIAEVTLSGTANAESTVVIASQTLVDASGTKSASSLSVTSRARTNQTGQGVVDLGTGITVRALGDQSSSTANLSGDKYLVAMNGNLNVEAVGTESVASLRMNTSSSTAVSLLPVDGLFAHASGRLAKAEFSFASASSEAKGNFTVNGRLSAKASVEAAESVVTVDARYGTIKIGNVETFAEMAGARATTTLGNPDLALQQESYIEIGQLLTRASGAEARAKTSLTATSLIGVGNLTAEATGDVSKADIEMLSVFAPADLGAIRVTAAGVDAHAGVKVKLGFLDKQTISGEVDGTLVAIGFEPVVYGRGSVTVTGGTQLLASGFEADAKLDLRALGGNVTITGGNLSVTAAGAKTEASAVAEAGTVDVYQVGMQSSTVIAVAGRVAVEGSALARAVGDHGLAKISIKSNGSEAKIARDLVLSAEANHAVAFADIISFSVDDARIAGTSLPDAPVRVGGSVSVSASGAQSAASSLLFSGRGQVNIGGALSVEAAGGNASSAVTLDARHGTIKTGGEALVAAIGSASQARLVAKTGAPAAAIPDEGSISFDKGLALLASGSSSLANAEIKADSNGKVAVGGALKIGAHGDQSSASLTLSAAGADTGGTGGATLVRALAVTGPLEVEATAAAAVASAQLEASSGSWSTQGIALLALGATSEARLDASKFTSAVISGNLRVLATGDGATAEVTLKATDSDLSLTGGAVLLASGDGSTAKATLTASAGKVVIGTDVNVGSLGEGSLASLIIEQRTTSDVSLAASLRLTADSGVNSAVGATARAELALGKLGLAETDLSMDAVQVGDKAGASLQLNAAGGKLQLGGEGQAGTAELNLLGRHLVDDVSISFEGSAGKAVINLQGQDVNATTAGSIGLVEIDGFRIAQDVIRFHSEGRPMTTVDSGQGTGEAAFRSEALAYFADTAVGRGLFAESVGDSMYVAYDYDGNGIDGIVVLDDVTLTQFRQYLTTTGLG